MIERYVDDTLLARVAPAHRRGRRLYVASTDLDGQRFMIWNMGLIATSGQSVRARGVPQGDARVRVDTGRVPAGDVRRRGRRRALRRAARRRRRRGERVLQRRACSRRRWFATAAAAAAASRRSTSSTTGSSARGRARRRVRCRASRCGRSSRPARRRSSATSSASSASPSCGRRGVQLDHDPRVLRAGRQRDLRSGEDGRALRARTRGPGTGRPGARCRRTSGRRGALGTRAAVSFTLAALPARASRRRDDERRKVHA